MQKLRANSDFILSVGLIGVFVPLIVYIVTHRFNIFGQIIFAAGIVTLGLYVGLEYQRILRILGGRQVRYGGNAVLMSLLFIGIIALLAFMSQRYSKRIDLTANRSFSISEQTAKVIDNLDSPVKIWAFYLPGDGGQVETLLKSYVARSRGKISYEMVDPDARPTLAQQYGLTQGEVDVLVLERGSRRQKVTGSTESDITSGLVKIARDQQKVVYLLTGHGEYSPDDTSQAGILLAKQALERDNYIVKSLNLTTGVTSTITATTGITVSGSLTGTTATRQFGRIPADAAALIVVSPQTPIPDGEWQVISQWVNNGGKLFLLQDALEGPSGLDDMLLVNWGIRVRNDLAIDPAGSALGDPATLVIQRGGFSPITKDMRSQIILPGARSVEVPKDTTQGTTFTPVAQTSDQSWGETDLANLNAGVRYDPTKDTRGPLNIGITVERDAPGGAKARLAIYGNARFVTDRWINSGANLDFFVNTVNWLTEDEQLISIRPRPPAQRTLFIPPTDANVISLGVVAGLPLLVLGLGAIVWWRRR